jgi:type II secretory pathway pseudopilin PulG
MRRTAKSLLELIVALAILAVLIGLILSAVAKVRDSANRARCQYSLHNTAIATLNYEATHGALPPGAVRGPWEELNIPAGVNHGFGVFLLPYLESGAAKRYSLEFGFDSVENARAVENSIPVFVCNAAGPSDRKDTLENGHTAGVMDYAPVHLNPFLVDQGVIEPLANYDGVLPTNRRTKLTDIRDGASQTLLLGGASPRDFGSAWCSPLNRIELRGGGSGTFSPRGLFSKNHTTTHAAMCDGSIRVFSRQTELKTLAVMVTPAAGDTPKDE